MKTIECDTRGEITLTTEVTAECPFDHLTDEYAVTVKYRPDEHAVELQSFANHLKGYADREISQERLAENLFRTFRSAVKPSALTVVVRGEHYGIMTEVRHP